MFSPPFSIYIRTRKIPFGRIMLENDFVRHVVYPPVDVSFVEAVTGRSLTVIRTIDEPEFMA